jgi:glucose-1-phosphate cytidylyltransferase
LKVIILAGGFGTRLSEYTASQPKPMVEIGGKPILWHVMELYRRQGYTDFLIALGYNGHVIKDYFINYHTLNSDFSVNLATGKVTIHESYNTDITVSLIDTGQLTMTGGRVGLLEKYIGDETFFVTYGDGLANIDLDSLLSFHRNHGKIATVTAVRPIARFGELVIGDEMTVTSFKEKPQIGEGWINGGFFVFEPELFTYIDNENTVLEKEPLERIATAQQLVAYPHEGFWQCMDTKRDHDLLSKLASLVNPPWFRD